MLRRVIVLFGLGAGLLLASAAPAFALQPYPLNFQTVDFTSGSLDGLAYQGGALKLAGNGSGTFEYTDPFSAVTVLGQHVDGSGSYAFGTWTSPVYPMNFAFNELVSSWNAKTPAGTWIQVEVQPQIDNGHWAKWYILGRWSSNDSRSTAPRSAARETPTGSFRSTPSSRRTIPRSPTAPADDLPGRARLAQAFVSRLSAIASNLTNQKGSFPSETTMNGHTGSTSASRSSRRRSTTATSRSTTTVARPGAVRPRPRWSSPTGRESATTTPDAWRVLWVTAAFPRHHTGSVGRLHRPRGLRLPLRRRRQLAVQHGLRRLARARRRRDAAAQPRRGRAVHQGGHPAGRLRRVALEQARRRHQEHERPPAGDRGFMPTVEGDRQRPGLDGRFDGQAPLQPRAVRAAWIPASGGIVYVDPPGQRPTPSLTANNN